MTVLLFFKSALSLRLKAAYYDLLLSCYLNTRVVVLYFEGVANNGTQIKGESKMKTTFSNLILILSALLLSFPSTSTAEELSQEKILCIFKNLEISIVAPMPKHWTREQKDKTGAQICNSIEETTVLSPRTSQAICDTDYNCEVLYEKYKTFGIAKIFVADETWQGEGRQVVEVICKDGRTKFANANIPEELEFVCESPDKSYENAKKESFESESGRTEDWTMDWKEIQTVLDKDPKDLLENTSNAAPSLEDFRDFTKAHPEAEAIGVYYKEEGLVINEIWVRFGNQECIPTWFLNFCDGSDENPTNNPTNYPGWRCWWD